MGKTVTIHLENKLRKRAEAGKHNFINKMMCVLERAGFEVDLKPNALSHRLVSSGHTLTHMKPPASAQGLVFRRVYYYPFWQIEETHERWHWRVANEVFDEGSVPVDQAEKFFGFWQTRLFGPLLETVSDEGFIYIPLQGRLLDHRSFQSCSPLEMIHQTRAAYPDKQIECALHPNEEYSAAEHEALEHLQRKDPKMRVRMGGMEDLLPRCSAIVTQNSGVAFNGYFLRKPALFFAGIDFHHIGLNWDTPNAFERLLTHQPNYAAYLWWFWQQQSINAGLDNAELKIAKRFAQFGWPMNEKGAP